MSDIKNTQLQIRISQREKLALKQGAAKLGLDVSQYVLNRLFPGSARKLQAVLDKLQNPKEKKFLLAEFNDLLTTLNSLELELSIKSLQLDYLNNYLKNYCAAMIETAAEQKKIKIPEYIKKIKALEKPSFASNLIGLRLYLLTHSPPHFRKRNIFIDSSIGDRV